jgi:hypothetical protein
MIPKICHQIYLGFDGPLESRPEFIQVVRFGNVSWLTTGYGGAGGMQTYRTDETISKEPARWSGCSRTSLR